MILEMNKGGIKVLENSCERKGECHIYMKFKDRIITNKEEISLFINDIKVDQIRPNVWKINHAIHDGTEDNVVVAVKKNGLSEIYKGVFKIYNYVSFGELGAEKLPQVILDLNRAISKLEERIKKLEDKSTVV